jgi:hemoglobin-like flavoprotein
MTPEQITLVHSSFEKVLPMSQDVARLFYGRLFELDPSLLPMFKEDMKEQERKLMVTLEIMVKGLTVQEVIVPALQELGKRHAGYGVKPEHYDTVASALLWTLEQGLGEEFTPDVREAWAEAYTLMAGVMKEASAQIPETPTEVGLQAQMQAQRQQLVAQQQQIDSTNNLVKELRDIFALLQQSSVSQPSQSHNGTTWWSRLWSWTVKPPSPYVHISFR